MKTETILCDYCDAIVTPYSNEYVEITHSNEDLDLMEYHFCKMLHLKKWVEKTI